MKVVHFIGSIDQEAGGTATYLQLLASELKLFTKIVIVTNKSPNPIDIEGVEIKFFDLGILNFLSLINQFKKFFKIEKPDLIHINGIWTPQNYLFQNVAQKIGIKVLLSPHGMLEPYILNRNSLKKKVALFLYQRQAIITADFLLATANSELLNFRKLGFTRPAGVVPNGLSIAGIEKKKLIPSEGSHLKILFLSRIHPKKGIELLIEAMYRLKDQKIRLVIAGAGNADYMEELRQLTIKRKVENKIVFVGGVYDKDKWELYAQADLFVLPTYSENFGLVVIEALAAGIPVITTKGTPWQELETFKCGWWIDMSIGALAKAILEAKNKSSVELHKMGERGRNLVIEKYDSKVIAKEMFGIYNNILNR